VIRFLNAYFPARTVLLGLSEVLLATLAFLMAMVVYQGTLNTRIALHYEGGGVKLALAVAVSAACMYCFDLYDSMVLRSRRETFTRVIQALGSVCIVLACIYTVFPATRIDHHIVLTGVALSGSLLLLARRLFLFINSRPALMERVVILGDGQLAQVLLDQLEERRELGFRVVCQLTEEQEWNGREGFGQDSFPQELQRLIRAQRVERIIVAMGDRRGRLPVEALLELKKEGMKIQDGAELFEIITGKVALDSLRPSTLLFSPGFQVARHFLIFKRLCAIVLSSIGLVVTLPLMLLITFAIRYDSPGPAVFRQRRIGKHGKPFTLYKFRSMSAGSETGGQLRPADKADERCTRLGRCLRATRLDELPQLWNILRGDMCFVGPRPFVPNQEEYCARNIPFYSHRWAVTPGATGWAQVNRGYCVTLEDNVEKLAYDLFYIRNISVGLDLLILFKTAKALLQRRGAQ
jgi:exopolysaccharide biosynthesis polyprenyl glycosylphosphotransferase